MAWVTGSKTCVDIMSSSGVTIEDIQRGQKREKERRRKEQTVNDQVMDITLGTCYKQVFVLIAVVAATVVAVIVCSGNNNSCCCCGGGGCSSEQGHALMLTVSICHNCG